MLVGPEAAMSCQQEKDLANKNRSSKRLFSAQEILFFRMGEQIGKTLAEIYGAQGACFCCGKTWVNQSRTHRTNLMCKQNTSIFKN